MDIELFVNILCPFARRTLCTLEFKGIQATVTEVDVPNKTAEFLAVSVLGKVPALRVRMNGQEFHLYESLQIVEYFDSFPGPALYPRLPDGTVNPLYKGLIDAHIQVYIMSCVGSQWPTVFKTPDYSEKCAVFLDKLQVLNDQFLSKGDYFMSGVIPYNEVTVADIALLGHMEFTSYLLEAEAEQFAGRDLGHFWAWYSRMGALDCVKKFKQPSHRYTKLVRMFNDGSHKGLRAPITFYDN